ncbi:coproporphyrinogen III oxidase [Stenotrophomonas sp. Iso1]|uniref:coproporphyrinogen III oxidase n=1 Tax=Stenotrophomonas sp. Iso1 TaxID=2977283 RepID=UPI0022B7D4F6|nr:coproporphyrinogen III oxidase [Stenotrophomonas sp. Iso1]
MSVEALPLEGTLLRNCVLHQPRHVLFPAASQFSPGFGEASWRAAIRASNEHLIPRVLTLGFQAFRAGPAVNPVAYLQALLSSLQLQAAELAEDREVAAVVLQLGLAEAMPPALLAQLLDAVPQYLRTVARPQVEVRVDAGSGIAPAQLREVGCTRLNVIDRAGAHGPELLAQGQKAGFTACYYQLRVPAADDSGFRSRLQAVLALAPERILMPSPCASVDSPSADAWWQAWTDVCAAGYLPLGGDHYQRADGSPPAQRGDGARHCDLAGVPRRDRSDFIGIGLGACSQIGDVICRQETDMARWQSRLQAGHSGVVAGLIFSEHERLTDEVVQSIACDHALDVAAFEWRNGLPFDECFEEALAELPAFIAHGWLRWDGKVLHLQREGQLLWRMIAACFRSTTVAA